MMPAIFSATRTGTPAAADVLLPQPAAAAPEAEERRVENLLTTLMLPLPEGDVAVSPAQDNDPMSGGESDPQQLLTLLLATPVTMLPAEDMLPQAGAATQAADMLLRDRAETENGGLLRTRILAAGRLPTMEQKPGPVTLAEPVNAASAQRFSVLQSVPQKLVSPAENVLTRPSMPETLRVEREPVTTDSTAHPAPALVNALHRGEMAGKTAAIVLPAASSEQAEALQKALVERLEVQIDRRVQKATIRLDPPNLGKVDISIHFESGKLQVQIQAAQPEVTRLLQQISHEMRNSLSEQNNVQVNVQVSAHGGDSRQQHRHRDRPETTIADNNQEVTTTQRGTDGTILTMA